MDSNRIVFSTEFYNNLGNGVFVAAFFIRKKKGPFAAARKGVDCENNLASEYAL